jgi:hypothetical protein
MKSINRRTFLDGVLALGAVSHTKNALANRGAGFPRGLTQTTRASGEMPGREPFKVEFWGIQPEHVPALPATDYRLLLI